jgi:hypothetical protein
MGHKKKCVLKLIQTKDNMRTKMCNWQLMLTTVKWENRSCSKIFSSYIRTNSG